MFLVSKGEIAVVRASLTGSIIGNLLLVLGAAYFAGGLRRRELTFSATAASTHVSSMALAVAGVLMPSICLGLLLQPRTRKPNCRSTPAALDPSVPRPMIPTEIALAGH